MGQRMGLAERGPQYMMGLSGGQSLTTARILIFMEGSNGDRGRTYGGASACT